MAALPIFKAIQESALGTTISQSTWMFPTIETAHVVALSLVFGSIAMVDLRLIGVASKDRSVTALTRDFLPWTWAAFALAAGTGTLLFVSRAADYMAIQPFLAKFVLMALAGANMLYFHFATQRSIKDWDTGTPPAAVKAAGLISLTLWALILICGRKVGFSL